MMNFPRWLLISAFIFFSCIIIGFLAPINIDIESIAPLGDIAEDLDSFSSPVVFLIILINNLIAISFAFVLSPVLCIIPLFSLVVNGLIIGIVGGIVVEQESFLYLLAGILPHGIFEIPALLIALAAALNFGFITLRGLLKKETRSLILPGFVTSAKYLAISAGLLIPAAFIETFVTPILLGVL
ncbi:MAG: stage II sporulation protein M [Dehalococcoidales bacterium]